MGMLNYLVAEPLRHRRPALGWYRLWQLVHDRTNGALDERYIQMSRIWRPPVSIATSTEPSPHERAALVSVLRRDGNADMPFRLSDSEISAIKSFAFATPARGADLNKEIRISEGSVPCHEGRFTWPTNEVIRNAAVQRLVTRGPYCAIAQDYLGCRPTLVTVSLWLNPPFKGYDANEYHYDNDGPGFLKFFFLLTDMGIGTGAHYFIKGSHSKTKPAAVAKSRLYREDEIFASYDRACEHIAGGAAGTIFAEDTMGFHRGSDIEQDYRMILQLEFSVIDTPTSEDLANVIQPVPVKGLDPGISRIVRKFYTMA